ncbi:MAG: hypothetical protein PHH14_02310 [Candidatus Margulisbacteria bacterium]|nr:hypothetical protein [Candidatus Margulisiibacteriota bacterium]
MDKSRDRGFFGPGLAPNQDVGLFGRDLFSGVDEERDLFAAADQLVFFPQAGAFGGQRPPPQDQVGHLEDRVNVERLDQVVAGADIDRHTRFLDFVDRRDHNDIHVRVDLFDPFQGF